MDHLDHVISASWHADEGAARQFFEALHESARNLREDGTADPAALGTALHDQQLPPESVDALIQVLEQVDTAAALDELVAAGPDELLDRYGRLLQAAYEQESSEAEAANDTGAGDGQEPDTTAEDGEAWNAYLAANGPAWNGTEEAWPQFVDWFLYHAAEAGVGDSAQAFLSYVTEQPDKIAAFAAYGVQIAAAAEDEASSAPEESYHPAELSDADILAEVDDILADLGGAEAGSTTETAGAPATDDPAELTAADITAEVDDILADLGGGGSPSAGDRSDVPEELAALSEEEIARLVEEVIAEHAV